MKITGESDIKMDNPVFEKGEIILYEPNNKSESVAVHLIDDTVWLTLNQMAELFGRDKSVISRHLNNIYKTGELEKEATVAKNATVQVEGGRSVTRNIEWYNLDAIISVGYRVNSKRGTQFRIWATNILNNHLVKGFTANRNRLAEKGLAGAWIETKYQGCVASRRLVAPPCGGVD